MGKNVEEFIKEYGDSKIDEMKSILEKHGKKKSNIYKALKYKVLNNTIEFIMPEYSKWVDEGRGPGKQPPLKKISQWTSRKNIPEKAAFPIARKIGKQGLPATNFKDPIKNLDDFYEGLEEAAARDIEEYKFKK